MLLVMAVYYCLTRCVLSFLLLMLHLVHAVEGK
jgi:hypothetical protein